MPQLTYIRLTGPGLSEVGLEDLGEGGGFMSRLGTYPLPHRSPPLGNLSVGCQVTRLQAGRVFQGAAAQSREGSLRVALGTMFSVPSSLNGSGLPRPLLGGTGFD